MPEYEVEVTLHEKGGVHVEADSVQEAVRLARAGHWVDGFDQHEYPRIGVRGARLVREASDE